MRKEYRISNFEAEVTPEETLMDSFGSSKVESPIDYSVLQIFYLLIAAVFIFFVFTSFRLQVLDGQTFKNIALGNRSGVYNIPSMRGSIFDNTGKVLAENRPVFDLIAISSDLPKEANSLNGIENNLSLILREPAEDLAKVFQEKSSQAVFFIKRDIQKDEVLQIQNLYQKGIYVVSGAKRWYEDGSQFSSIVGYTGKVSQEDLKDSYYDINDRKGRAGVEESYESYLRGGHGQIFFDKSSNHDAVQAPTSGQDLVLNINGDIQKHLYDSLQNVLQTAGLRAGSAVVQNPKTGEILGLVSFPSFDNNQLSADLNEDIYKKYFKGQDRAIFNRAIGGNYNPGSTIKPLLALSGLKEGIITPATTITDLSGYITIPNVYYPDIIYKYRDWKVQGTVNLKKAIAQSSDIYFYSVGGGYGDIKGLGFATLEKYFHTFLIDQPLGIDLSGESAGFVPSEEWKLEKFGQPWFTGDTYNVSIGQGDLLVTPLWLSSYVSAIANGGIFYRPFLVKKIVDKDRKTVKEFSSQEIAKLPFNKETFSVVQDAMREVVLSGTAQLLKNLPAPVAAKTGTAEVGEKASGKLNSVLIAYAPYDNPQIALSVVVENIGKKQGLALLTAKSFLEWYLGVPAPKLPFLNFTSPTLSAVPSGLSLRTARKLGKLQYRD